MLRAGASQRTHRLLDQAAKSIPVSTVILPYTKKGHSCDKTSPMQTQEAKKLTSHPTLQTRNKLACTIALVCQGRSPQPSSILAAFSESASLGTSLNIKHVPRLLCIFKSHFIPLLSISLVLSFWCYRGWCWLPPNNFLRYLHADCTLPWLCQRFQVEMHFIYCLFFF